MSEIPTPVSESTAIEVVRREGSARSFKSVSTITAGDFVYFANNSGVVQTIEAIDASRIPGVALYDAASGNRVTTIKGKARARWDGTGTVGKGTQIVSSDLRSGWFEPLGASTSGTLIIGYSHDVLAAANSGLLNVVEVL